MSDCCVTNSLIFATDSSGVCPSCKIKGRKVSLITIKSLLKPSALEMIRGEVDHYFCSTRDCNVVYFDTNGKTYSVLDIKVKVYQKCDASDVPVCYCFGWTREKIQEYTRKGNFSLTAHIRENIKANRCGCEVNNPQGSCCLGNVSRYIKEMPSIHIQ
ncbi:(2Fe-2S)-binding protein [Sporolactobacillus sp. THM7-7]|nr:(2Fe-2S)-binding protein [Sporolactobacillus sp. THM7-7]